MYNSSSKASKSATQLRRFEIIYNMLQPSQPEKLWDPINLEQDLCKQDGDENDLIYTVQFLHHIPFKQVAGYANFILLNYS